MTFSAGRLMFMELKTVTHGWLSLAREGFFKVSLGFFDFLPARPEGDDEFKVVQFHSGAQH
jgi:hypothetical protein